MKFELYTHDLDEFEPFVRDLNLGGRTLVDQVAEIQYLYLKEAQPWVVAFSGGKDSHAILTLMYFALLGLAPEQRKYPVSVVFCDTLAEVPFYLNKTLAVLKAVAQNAKQQDLPLTTEIIRPKASDTFWSRLLGRGYPAPQLKFFRWCTEKIKIQPFRDYINSSRFDGWDPIVMIGSRSEESSSRAKTLEKYHSDHEFFDYSDKAYRRYAPIKAWSTVDVWTILGQNIIPGKYEDLEVWDSPWGKANTGLLDLYFGTAGEGGECPLVEDNSSPGCGKSRFGCWSCTVVTKDKAVDGLISQGEKWMEPLAEFRNMIHRTTDPSAKENYRNEKRRDGRIHVNHNVKSEDEIVFTRGPYFMKYRQAWLEQLLTMEKTARDAGQDVQLISEAELHEIRKQWRIDPIEPDWKDSLPKIYAKVYGEEAIDWPRDDDSFFGALEDELIELAAPRYQIDSVMVKKLIELQFSYSGLNVRRGFFDKLENVLKQDWDAAEEAKGRKAGAKATELGLKEEHEELNREVDDLEKLIKEEF